MKKQIFSYKQDLVQNPQYSLLMYGGTSDVTYFSDANSNTNPNEAILWQRSKDNPKCFAENYENAEAIILENPLSVFFGTINRVPKTFKNYPCLIDTSSQILAKVISS